MLRLVTQTHPLPYQEPIRLEGEGYGQRRAATVGRDCHLQQGSSELLSGGKGEWGLAVGLQNILSKA